MFYRKNLCSIMTSTPLRVNAAQQNALDVFISPQSTSRKHSHKRTSIGGQILMQTPTDHLPDAAENELDSARQRRHSRNFTGIPLNDKNDTSDSLPSSKWSKDELLQHYSQCIKLSQENKINHKNAFDLQLIEHMAEMIKQDGALNFRVAGGTIFAGAKIYASRVDAIHSQIYRVLGSLSSGDKEDNQEEDDNTVNDTEKKTRKRKKNSKILETVESNLRLQTINCLSTEEARGRSKKTAIDAASSASFMLNHVGLNSNETTLQYNSESLVSGLDSATTITAIPSGEFPFSNFSDDLSRLSLSTTDICPMFKDFDFDATNVDRDFLTSRNSDDDDVDVPAIEPDDETVNGYIKPCLDEDPGPDEDDPVFESQPGLLSNEKPKEIHNVLDVTDLVAIAPAAEYSYFMPNALAVCDGPSHWRKLRSHRATIASIKDKEVDAEAEKPRPKKRKVEEKRDIAKNGRVLRGKRLQPQKVSKSKLESLRKSVQDQLLLEYETKVAESLTRAKDLCVVLKPLTPDKLKEANVNVADAANAVNFNYMDDDYCPPMENDDHDNSADLFPDNSERFFPDFTQNVSNTAENRTENQMGEYTALLEGDHLVDQPRKTDKIQIHFAKRAKRIDVRRLKSAMWTVINDDESNAEPNRSEALSSEAQARATAEPSSSAASSNGSQLFSEMYSRLPEKVSKSTWENLSVPLAFTCLLHLANEKQLKIEGTSSLCDIKISQELERK